MKNLTKIVAGLAGATALTIGAPAASAAETTVWDKVAACESSSDWDINTGNGFYGGLQFTDSTWREFGGTEFAERADLAAKDEQIIVAQRVLEVQGPQAWPKCSIVAGLTEENGGADMPFGLDEVDEDEYAPKRVDTSSPTPAATTPVEARRAKATPVATQAPTPEPAPSAPSKIEDVVTWGEADEADDAEQEKSCYTVKKGDTLISIARAHGLGENWSELYALNKDQIDNPDLIYIGQRFII